jgi:predicted ATPase
VLDRLFAAVRGGQSRVLVVSGEPGVGKTALLQSVIESAPGMRVARTGLLEGRLTRKRLEDLPG